MTKIKFLKNFDLLILIILLVLNSNGFSQYGKKYEGPDDPAGDQAAVRSADFNGNRIYFYLNNNSSICDTGHGRAIWNRWPDDYTGFTMVHGINAVMAVRVYVDDEGNPVDDLAEIQTRDDLNVLYFGQHGWRGRNDMDPTGTIEWGMKPVITYMNPLSESMALSNDSLSWPTNGWPARGDELKWPGEFNGRFGRGVTYADLEAFYVVNDAQDQEKLGDEDTLKYYPRPGVKIGDKNPNVTIQKGLPWGGLGLRWEVRGFQWNNPQARDAAFFEYTAANISDYDLQEVCFGYYFHPYVGEDQGLTGDDYLYYNIELDLAYNWDSDGIGLGGIKTGALGMAYLESPAKPFDGIDNDDDGIIDEQRDNTAQTKVGKYDGIADLQKFLTFYNYTEDMLKEHWDADEDQDWQDGNDANENGIYDNGEDPGDDVGLDGVGPGELNYFGPDEGECNHKPDFVEGLGSEPNFAFTDVSESDMLGLTSFHTYDHESRPGIHDDDVGFWNYFSDSSFDPFQDAAAEWVNMFATGIFPLYKGRTERISMALIASFDPLEGLNSPDHRAPALFRKKEVTQIIYERDYRFAQPPKMPTLHATAADGKVILTWDNAAELYTREPLLGNANDFEGYKLYKATDKKFSDPEIITNGYGTPMYKKPIFQCDLIDNKKDFTDFGLIDGAAYYLGNDTGIQHYFVDENVENGKTYYYAIVAYDFGVPEIGNGVTPTENNIILELDDAEEIKSHGRNVQVVTPHQNAAGYVPSDLEILKQTWNSSAGTVVPHILSRDRIQENHIYNVTFTADTIQGYSAHEWGVRYTTNGYKVYDVTDGKQVVLSKVRTTEEFTPTSPANSFWIDSLSVFSLNYQNNFFTDEFEGLNLDIKVNSIFVDSAITDYDATGWKIGNNSGRVGMKVTTSPNMKYFPWEYEIIFGDPGVYTGINSNTTRVRDELENRTDKNDLLLQQDYNFYVINKTFPDSSGEYPRLDLTAFDSDSNGVFDLAHDRVFVGTLDSRERWQKTLFVIEFEENSEMPEPNDVYKLCMVRPFFIADSLTFRVLPHEDKNLDAIGTTMDSIQVVPNPYIATNRMETSVANYFLNQRRQIMFTHIPARCEIKIFTISGVLVDEIDVENFAENGTAFWDLNTKEGLEVAAGVYVYYVKSKETGEEKIGKFGIIK